MKKKKAIQMRKRRRALATLLCIVFVCLVCLFSCGSKRNDGIVAYENYVVSYGDTLWEIADKFYGDSIDIRIPIRHIEEINDIPDARIYGGDVLLLPVYAD